jgi:hypothetical protein
MTTHVNARFAVLMAALLLTGCAGTHSDYVRSALAETATGELLGDLIVDELPEGGWIEYTLSVDEPGFYRIDGACDIDCSDIDLQVYDTDGELLFEDTASDDLPQLAFDTDGAVSFVVAIRMVACATETCVFGLGLYSDFY